MLEKVYVSGNVIRYKLKASIWIYQRWYSKFEKSGITTAISTEQRGSFREEATLNEDPYDFYC